MGQGGMTAPATPSTDGPGFGGNMGNEGMGAGMGMGFSGTKAGFPNQMMMGMGMRAEMMAGMMMRNGASDKSNYNAADQPNPEMMAEMMRRNSVGGAATNNSRMMPQPPFDGNDFGQRQQGGGDGGGQNFVSGRDDDNPALPEYGWGQNGRNQR